MTRNEFNKRHAQFNDAQRHAFQKAFFAAVKTMTDEQAKEYAVVVAEATARNAAPTWRDEFKA